MIESMRTDGFAPSSAETGISLGEATRLWFKVGCLGFGGPAGQIALMHRLVVDEKRWVGEERFLHALNYCMMLPGPEAQQLAIYLGWLLHRTLGELIAGILFVLPGAIVMFGLSLAYVWSRQFELSAGVFLGLKAAVLAIVVEAVIRIGRRSLKNRLMIGIAAAAFLAIYVFQVPFPLIVLGAGVIGAIGAARRPDLFKAVGHGGGAGQAGLIDRIIESGGATHTKPRRGHVWRTLLLWLPLWLAPVAVLVLLLGPDHVFSKISLFFSQMAVVTFGGAYAVLAYVAQEAVQGYGWLQPGDMLDGLALAETTPGPLILVLQFVGFLGAYHAPGALAPWFAGLIACVATDTVGDFRTLLSLDLPRRALCGVRPFQRHAQRRAGRHHRRRGRRDPQSRALVRAAQHLRGSAAVGGWRPQSAGANSFQHQLAGAGAHCLSAGCDAALQDRDDCNANGRRADRRPASGAALVIFRGPAQGVQICVRPFVDHRILTAGEILLGGWRLRQGIEHGLFVLRIVIEGLAHLDAGAELAGLVHRILQLLGPPLVPGQFVRARFHRPGQPQPDIDRLALDECGPSTSAACTWSSAQASDIGFGRLSMSVSAA